jgi:hypothetical protein
MNQHNAQERVLPYSVVRSDTVGNSMGSCALFVKLV